MEEQQAYNTDDERSTLIFHRKPSYSFLDAPIGSFKGPNTLHNFASSFTRAQSFAASKIDNAIHKQRSFFHDNKEVGASYDELFDPDYMVPSIRGRRLSLAIQDTGGRHQIVGAGYTSMSPNEDVFYQDDVLERLNDSRTNSVTSFHVPPTKRMIVSPSFSSFNSSLSRITTASQVNLKTIESKDGKDVTVLAGQSTAPQTVFNSINVLIGVGLLALPVGILKAGLIPGVLVMSLCVYMTYWSATLISRSMDTDQTIMTYADLGYAAYGSKAKLIIVMLFSIDLIGAGVSLIVLFTDSLYALIGDENILTKTNLKIISFFILTPFTFMPLSVLSIISLLGITSTISITVLVFACGFLKSTSPGSLVAYMPPNFFPDNYKEFLLSIGILMAPFGGHAIFPNLKSDMRHPHKFTNTLAATYSITFITDLSMAILGFLMFGKNCNNEITNNILTTKGYPPWVYYILSVFISIIPLAKTPLNAKPIVSSLDDVLCLHDLNSSSNAFISTLKAFGRFSTKILVNAIFVALAILFPEFEKIIGILGASICFFICLILPCLFYYRLCHDKTTQLEKFVLILVICLSLGLASVATYAVVMF